MDSFIRFELLLPQSHELTNVCLVSAGGRATSERRAYPVSTTTQRCSEKKTRRHLGERRNGEEKCHGKIERKTKSFNETRGKNDEFF